MRFAPNPLAMTLAAGESSTMPLAKPLQAKLQQDGNRTPSSCQSRWSVSRILEDPSWSGEARLVRASVHCLIVNSH